MGLLDMMGIVGVADDEGRTFWWEGVVAAEKCWAVEVQ
jgi:hypothetical protein